jgi:hypothetical protein
MRANYEVRLGILKKDILMETRLYANFYSIFEKMVYMAAWYNYDTSSFTFPYSTLWTRNWGNFTVLWSLIECEKCLFYRFIMLH